MWQQVQDNGKVRFFERFTDARTGKERVLSVTMDKDTKATRKAALAALTKKSAKLGARPAAKDEVTVEQLARLRVASQRSNQDVKTSTSITSDMALRGVIKVLGADTKASKLTAQYVRSKLDFFEVDAVTKNGRIKHIRSLVRWGYNEGYLSDISWLGKLHKYKEPITYRERIEDFYLEKQDLLQLLNGLRMKDRVYIFKFLALTGMRLGELIALKKTDVDTKKRIIRISCAMSAVSGEITTPKNAYSVREIYIQDELLELIKEMRDFWDLQASFHHYETNLFVSDTKGQPYKHATLETYLKENALRILGRKVHPHMLRHTHVSLLIEAAELEGRDIKLKEIAARIGHGAIQKLQNGYTSTKQRNFKRRATRKCVPSGFCKFATQKLRDT